VGVVDLVGTLLVILGAFLFTNSTSLCSGLGVQKSFRCGWFKKVGGSNIFFKRR
jgi:hypothetical protein